MYESPLRNNALSRFLTALITIDVLSRLSGLEKGASKLLKKLEVVLMSGLNSHT
jgi:hypothetical protein